MRARRVLATGVLTIVCFVSAPPADAAEPIVASSCSAAVTGDPGQQVMLDPASVAEPIVGVLAGLDPLGLLTGPFRSAWNSAGPIPLGTVPQGQTEIPGSQVADAVVERLGQIPAVGPVLQPLVPAVRGLVSSLCGLLVRGERPPAPPSSKPSPVAPGNPASSPSPSTSERSAWRPVGADESSAPGRGAVFGERLPGLFGSGAAVSLNTAGVPGAAVDPGAQPPQSASLVNPAVQTGEAHALPADQRQLSQPILLAVLLLTVVSAQLVRRWALGARR